MAIESDDKLLISSREPGRVSDLYDNAKLEALYVDGVGQILMGSAVSRLSFFSTIDLEDQKIGVLVEKRKLDLKLVIPTIALVEFAAGILASAISEREAITGPNKALNESIERAMAIIKIASPANG